jgi:hypothetical protein
MTDPFDVKMIVLGGDRRLDSKDLTRKEGMNRASRDHLRTGGMSLATPDHMRKDGMNPVNLDLTTDEETSLIPLLEERSLVLLIPLDIGMSPVQRGRIRAAESPDVDHELRREEGSRPIEEPKNS